MPMWHWAPPPTWPHYNRVLLALHAHTNTARQIIPPKHAIVSKLLICLGLAKCLSQIEIRLNCGNPMK